MAEKLRRYEKIDFLGEGQVKIFCYFRMNFLVILVISYLAYKYKI
jgi:hypothetical protein